MIRQSAIVNLITPQQIVGTLMRAQPHSSSAIHHHGNQDTIVYAVSGRGAIVSEGGKQVHKLEPGDWALIPKGREHQEVNEGDEEVRTKTIGVLQKGKTLTVVDRSFG